MTTTALFVEILVIGAVCEIWVGILLAAVGGSTGFFQFLEVLKPFAGFAGLLTVPLLAITYALGWIMNFVAERSFRPFFQSRFRDEVFGDPLKYEKARVLVFQKGSAELIHEIQIDRHIIRIARAGFLNFVMLTAAVSVHLRSDNWLIVILSGTACLVVAAISAAQWFARYKSYYKRLTHAANLLAQSEGTLPTTALQIDPQYAEIEVSPKAPITAELQNRYTEEEAGISHERKAYNSSKVFDKQFELLKLEITLIDSAIRAQDDITKNIKNWAIVSWTASIGLAVSREELHSLLWATAFVPIAFWIVDGAFRRVQRSFIVRLQDIADFLNSSTFAEVVQSDASLSFPLMKMRNKTGFRTTWAIVMLFRTVSALYLLMILGSGIMWVVINNVAK